MLGDISWRGPLVGRRVCGESESRLTAAGKVSSVGFVSGSWVSSVRDGLGDVVDQGSGLTT